MDLKLRVLDRLPTYFQNQLKKEESISKQWVDRFSTFYCIPQNEKFNTIQTFLDEMAMSRVLIKKYTLWENTDPELWLSENLIICRVMNSWYEDLSNDPEIFSEVCHHMTSLVLLISDINVRWIPPSGSSRIDENFIHRESLKKFIIRYLYKYHPPVDMNDLFAVLEDIFQKSEVVYQKAFAERICKKT
jgi:hypothetical protein